MPPSDKLFRVVVDTNVWVSFLIGKRLARLGEFIFDERVELLVCRRLLDELVTVLARKKFAVVTRKGKVPDLIATLESVGTWIDVTPTVTASPDPGDRYLLDLCVCGKADHFLTGDRRLLDLHHIGSTAILTFAQFEALVQPS